MESDKEHEQSSLPTEAFGYLEMPRDGFSTPETFREKFVRKTKENPLVPMGLVATVTALSYGLWQMKTGDRAMSQKMMRMRIYAQSFTVFALLAGIVYQSKKRLGTSASDAPK
jgi:hypothetical protein